MRGCMGMVHGIACISTVGMHELLEGDAYAIPHELSTFYTYIGTATNTAEGIPYIMTIFWGGGSP